MQNVWVLASVWVGLALVATLLAIWFKSGAPNACYAVPQNGQISLRSFKHPIETTAEKIHAMPVAGSIQDDPEAVLRTGSPRLA
jgi:hypothetical protein